MCKIRSVKCLVLSLGLLTYPTFAQIQTPHDGDLTVVITPVAPVAPVTASIDVYSDCTTPGPPLSMKGVQHSVSGAVNVEVPLANKLSAGEAVCAIETFGGAGAPPTKIFPTVNVASLAAGPIKVVIEPVYSEQTLVFVDPVPSPSGYATTIDIYAACSAGGAPVGGKLQNIGLQNSVDSTGAKLAMHLNAPPKKGSGLCAIETYVGAPAKPADYVSITVIDPPSKIPILTPFIAVGGIDVSAAAATDPSAKFLLDGSLDIPLLFNASNPFDKWIWASGYIRIASIAQPSSISGISNIATYIKPLTDSTPSQLVQSAEANFDLGARLFSTKSATANTEVDQLLFIANGGVITPLSPTQANPTVYVVNQALYNYYNSGAQNVPATSTAAINAACGTSFSSTTPCYIAYVPQDRSRFFRSWSGGFEYKRYLPGSTSDGSYLFPTTTSITFGQNEYVTGGAMHGFVLHASSLMAVPAPLASSLAGFLYVYGAIDMGVGGGKTISQPQFLLQTAGSTITPSSNNVANIVVGQPNRDRYRFGIALDLGKLYSLAKGQAKSGS